MEMSNVRIRVTSTDGVEIRTNVCKVEDLPIVLEKLIDDNMRVISTYFVTVNNELLN